MTTKHTLKAGSTILGAALLAASTAACALDVEGVEAAPDLQAHLETRQFLDLAPSSHVGVVATNPGGEALPYVEPEVVGGRAVMRTTPDGWLLVEDLEVQLADVRIPPGELGPNAVQLTDVWLRLGTQLDASPFWSGDGRAAWAAGDADLLLDWSLVLSNGDAWPLATQKIEEMDFTVGIVLGDDGMVQAEVATSRAGQVHQIAGLVTFSDLSVVVDAVETID